MLVAVPTERATSSTRPSKRSCSMASLSSSGDSTSAARATRLLPRDGLLRRARVELRRLRVDLGEEVTGPAVKLLGGGATSPVPSSLLRWTLRGRWRRTRPGGAATSSNWMGSCRETRRHTRGCMPARDASSRENAQPPKRAHLARQIPLSSHLPLKSYLQGQPAAAFGAAAFDAVFEA